MTGPRLLLVEDSETQALQIRRVLERSGFFVDRRASAEAAMEALNERLPDLVVADYHLPGMNGGELARRLRLNVRTRAIPVLMLTEASEPGLEREGLESGADAYVAKSADQELIVLRIRSLLRKRGAAADAVAAQAPPAETGLPHGIGLFRQARILLLRDPVRAADGLAGLLGRDGYDVAEAGLPDEASSLLSSGDWDCVLVDLASTRFDGLALCAQLDRLRRDAARPEGREEEATGARSGWRILALAGSAEEHSTALVARAYEAGVDDVISELGGVEAVQLRVGAVLRRKLVQDESLRMDMEAGERRAAMERARAEAAANAAKASLAEALAQANAELADANDALREAQGKLVQSAKMASLGELVAGIAHEINNPLAFILGHQSTVERLLSQLAELPAFREEEAARRLDRARDRTRAMALGLKRIQDLVLNLRRFSRLDESAEQLVDVPEAIDTLLTLLTHKLGSLITVSRHFEAPRELLCQPALLNQVIMNIVGNAADALNAQRIGRSDAGEGRIEIATRLEGGSYVISVEDNGPGVPEELRDRIFEPFFTTKPVGSGTGLGLAIAYNVVQAHGGTIAIERSDLGGARFTLAVPVRP